MNRSRTIIPLAAACGTLILAGCGERRLDADKLEGKIKAGIEQQAGVKIRSVACPSNIKIKAGNVFTCKATTTAGETATVHVTQKDDKGNVNYRVGG